MKPMKPDQFLGFAKKRLPGRDFCEDMLAAGLMFEAQGDTKFGLRLQAHAHDMLALRQAAKGGKLDRPGSRHWKGD